MAAPVVRFLAARRYFPGGRKRIAVPDSFVTAEASPGPRKSAAPGRCAWTVTPPAGAPSTVVLTAMEERPPGAAAATALGGAATDGSPISVASPKAAATGFFPGNANRTPAE